LLHYEVIGKTEETAASEPAGGACSTPTDPLAGGRGAGGFAAPLQNPIPKLELP